jgi:hypothetical protein
VGAWSEEEWLCAFKCGDIEDLGSCNSEDLKDLCRWTGSKCEYVPYNERDECNLFSSGVCATVLGNNYCEWRAGGCRWVDQCPGMCLILSQEGCEDFFGDDGNCKYDEDKDVWRSNCRPNGISEQAACKQTKLIGLCEWDGSYCVDDNDSSDSGFSFLPSSLLLISAAFLFLLF